jgi:hypothetical protein
MSAPRWNVKVQANTGSALGWITKMNRLPFTYALTYAGGLAKMHPEWQWRLVDETTGEVTHLKDGQPVGVEVTA